MLESLLAVAVFTGVVLLLSLVILGARALLLPTGEVTISINDQRELRARAGWRLHDALAAEGIRLPAACGGKGTCGMCRVRVLRGGGPLLPVETALLPRSEQERGARLACQLVLRGDLALQIPEGLLGVRQLVCRVRSTKSVATFIRELVLELPADEPLEFEAGAFVELTAPPFRARFSDFELDSRFRAEWERLGLLELEASASHPTTRAYSLANRPDEKGLAVLDVRIATPPPGAPTAPPGRVSSWIFSLRPGDEVRIAGPFGNFKAETSEREMVFVGGGAGMAPMRAHVFDQLERLRSRRRISFWYGARSRRELFYVEDFDRLAAEHESFSWTVALSEPRPDDAWDGPTGFIHEVLRDRYLAQHPAPASCEYYLCGPPLMVAATRHMLEDLDVPPERIHFDDFGG